MVSNMNLKQVTMLLLMSAIWGASFVFMKILVPIFGPFMTTSIRLLSATLFMYFYLLFSKFKMVWKGNVLLYIIIGVFNSAIPFALFSIAVIYIDASIEVVLNSTSPMFAALFAYILLKKRLSKVQLVGLITGIIGVAIVSSVSLSGASIQVILSILACLLAASLYGFSGVFIKKHASHIESKMMTMGSLLFAGLAVLPFSFSHGIVGDVTPSIIVLLLTFGVVGTAVTYLMYFALIKQVGATKALTVTYLMPSFGVLWAYLFVDEVPTLNIYIGTVVIFAGVYLTTKKTSK